MDETMFGWIFLVLMLMWRGLQTFPIVQRCLHACGRLAFILQWYTVTFLGLTALLIRTVWDIVIYDYVGYHFLDPEIVNKKIAVLCSTTSLNKAECDELTHKLAFPHWLRILSLSAPLAGILAFGSLGYLLWRFVSFNHRKKIADEVPAPWHLAQRLEWVIIIIGTPLVFIVMSMRALIRIWAVMTTSAWKPGVDWTGITHLEISTYDMDLELAVTFQFYAVMMFGFLCTSFLEHSSYIQLTNDNEAYEVKRYRRTLSYTAVQGVYAFVFIGVLRSMFDIGVTYFQETPKYKDIAMQIEEKALTKVGAIFTFVTLLCMVNMVLVSKVRDIRDNLGNANLKFLGTRLLLLLAQIQPQVLNGVTVGSTMYQSIRNSLATRESYPFGFTPTQVEGYFDQWTFTAYQSKLLHAALLNYECLIVVLVTICFWRLTDEQKASLMFDEQSRSVVQAREIASGYQPLLDA